METIRSPIRDAPLTVAILATDTAPVESIVATWMTFVDAAPAGSQLLVVADGFPVSLAERPRLRVVHHVQSLGLGPALQTAIWSLATPLVLFPPLDGSLSPGQVPVFLDRIDNADIVSACRNVGPTPFVIRVRDLLVQILTRVFLGYAPEPRQAWPGWSGGRRRWIARHLFGVPLLDPECGVLLARREGFARIPIQSTGSFAWVELLAKANHLGLLLDEVALPGRPRPGEWFAQDAWRVFHRPDFGPA